MSNEIENETNATDNIPALRRPFISVEGGEPWYLYQLRFQHDEKTYATNIYARSDEEAQQITDSLRASAIVDARLMSTVRGDA